MLELYENLATRLQRFEPYLAAAAVALFLAVVIASAVGAAVAMCLAPAMGPVAPGFPGKRAGGAWPRRRRYYSSTAPARR